MENDQAGLMDVLRPGKLWLYFLLQTLVAGFISFWPNFGIAWSSYRADLAYTGNATFGLWTWPVPIGGDLIMTVAIQTFLTFMISCFLISVDRKNGPAWLFGVQIVDVPASTFPFLSKIYAHARPFTVSDWSNSGCRGVPAALLRAGFQVLLWLVLLALPATILTCIFFLPTNVQFNGVQLAVGKGVWGFLISLIQVPFFVWITLMVPPRDGYETVA